MLRDGHLVSRQSDFIVYSVEAGNIHSVVKEYGPSTKVGAIVAGQTSVKAPEREAFETLCRATRCTARTSTHAGSHSC